MLVKSEFRIPLDLLQGSWLVIHFTCPETNSILLCLERKNYFSHLP